MCKNSLDKWNFCQGRRRKHLKLGGRGARHFESIFSLRPRSHDVGTFWKRWKMWRIGLPFTRKRHILKTVDFENWTLTGRFWKRHRVNTWKWWKKNIFRRFGVHFIWHQSLAKSFLLPNFPPFPNCSGIVWTLAQILLPYHFSPFSKFAGIVWTHSKKKGAIFWK